MKMMLADCRVKVTVDVIRGKWKAIIIKALKDRGLGYAELRRIVPEPTKKVLTDHLRELEADRIISRTASAGRNGRTESSLSEYGRTLIPVLAVMRAVGSDAQRTGTRPPQERWRRYCPLRKSSPSGPAARLRVSRGPNLRILYPAVVG
jgi:DNA-binding HxlR family transcriptional regulator